MSIITVMDQIDILSYFMFEHPAGDLSSNRAGLTFSEDMISVNDKEFSNEDAGNTCPGKEFGHQFVWEE